MEPVPPSPITTTTTSTTLHHHSPHTPDTDSLLEVDDDTLIEALASMDNDSYTTNITTEDDRLIGPETLDNDNCMLVPSSPSTIAQLPLGLSSPPTAVQSPGVHNPCTTTNTTSITPHAINNTPLNTDTNTNVTVTPCNNAATSSNTTVAIPTIPPLPDNFHIPDSKHPFHHKITQLVHARHHHHSQIVTFSQHLARSRVPTGLQPVCHTKATLTTEQTHIWNTHPTQCRPRTHRTYATSPPTVSC